MKQKQLINEQSSVIQYALERFWWIQNHCQQHGADADPHKIRVVAAGAIEEIKRQLEAA